MESNRGWSKDFGKRRYDVTIQEVDLRRLLAEREVDPVATAARMTAWDVQMVMDHQADAFMHWSMAKEPDEPTEAHQATAAAHLAACSRLLDKYAPRPPAGKAAEASAAQPAF